MIQSRLSSGTGTADLARHLYCHKLLNQYKMSYQAAAKMLGHSQIKQTMHYGKLWDSTVLDEFKLHQNRCGS